MKTIIVAGIARSGLTMTMQMLKAGGYPCVGEYPAFEPYHIGRIPVGEITGKAVKIVDTHLQFPPEGEYYVIRLRRNYKEQAKSTAKFLRVLGLPVDRTAIKTLEKSFAKDMAKIDGWAKKQKGMMILDFEDIIDNPYAAAWKIAGFLQTPMSCVSMARAVFKRSSKCYPGMLEYKMLK